MNDPNDIILIFLIAGCVFIFIIGGLLIIGILVWWLRRKPKEPINSATTSSKASVIKPITNPKRVRQNSEVTTKKCLYCAETIQAEAVVCRYCGRDLLVSKRQKKWYMSTEIKILTFLFFTPLWTLIVLDDPDSTTGVKVLASILLFLYIGFICFPLYDTL